MTRQTGGKVLTLAVLGGIVAVLLASVPGNSSAGARAWAQDTDGGRVYLPIAVHPGGTRATPVPTASPVTPTATPTTPPTATATAIPPTQAPTEVPTPAATATQDLSDWLHYVAYYRWLAGLPPVTQNATWSHGDELHAKYMVKNGVIGHSEDPARQYYTAEGNEAAAKGNVFLMGATNYYGTYRDAIDSWMTGPFHMLAIIDPHLLVSGFGDYGEDIGGMHRYAATLDVWRGRGDIPAGVTFPIYYPRDGQVMPNLSYAGGESPDPLLACSGYKVPTGPPIALQIGPGDQEPHVTKTSVTLDGVEQAHCRFDETNYPGSVGQAGLDMHDAIVIMPRQPLTAGGHYQVTIVSSGVTYSWSFTAGGR